MIEFQIIAILVSLLGSTIGLNFTIKGLRASEKREQNYASIQNSVITQRKNLSVDLKTRLSSNATPHETFETLSTYFDSIADYETKLKGKYYDASKSNHIDILVAQVSLACAAIGALGAIGLQFYS